MSVWEDTAVEVQQKISYREARLRLFRDLVAPDLADWQKRLFDRIVLHTGMFRPVPQTDDMRQMLDDLGIDPGKGRMVYLKWK